MLNITYTANGTNSAIPNAANRPDRLQLAKPSVIRPTVGLMIAQPVMRMNNSGPFQNNFVGFGMITIDAMPTAPYAVAHSQQTTAIAGSIAVTHPDVT